MTPKKKPKPSSDPNEAAFAAVSALTADRKADKVTLPVPEKRPKTGPRLKRRQGGK
jgi:hypothetical protein